MNNTTIVSKYLESKNIAHRVFRHPGPIHSLEQAARERGQTPDQVVRSIVFRIGRDEFVMVLVAGPDQVSWPVLRKYLDLSRLTMASKEEVLQVTGYETGAVSPFGLPTPMRILVDEAVFAPAEISIGSGERGTTIILTREAMMDGVGEVEVGSFVTIA
jgi:Cys-tRNA(Pro) deacylase